MENSRRMVGRRESVRKNRGNNSSKESREKERNVREEVEEITLKKQPSPGSRNQRRYNFTYVVCIYGRGGLHRRECRYAIDCTCHRWGNCCSTGSRLQSFPAQPIRRIRYEQGRVCSPDIDLESDRKTHSRSRMNEVDYRALGLGGGRMVYI